MRIEFRESRFITVHPGIGGGQSAAVIDWPDAVAALGVSLPGSGGEQRMLKITASLTDSGPLTPITGLNCRNATPRGQGYRPGYRAGPDAR